MKIAGETLLLSPLTADDVDFIASVWDSYRYVSHSDVSKQKFSAAVSKMNANFDGTLQTKALVTLAIRLKSDPDGVIGYTIFKVVPEASRADFLFTIIAEEHQSQGLYSELNILRHKFVYQDSSPVKHTQIRVFTNKERQAGTLAALYTRSYDPATVIDHGPMHWSYITKDEWLTWINNEGQSAKKQAAFEVFLDEI
jgi:hypothetical protein